MPLPIVPAPMIATLAIGIVGVSFGTSGTRATARSAKNACTSALHWSERRHSKKISRSRRTAVGKRQRGRGLDRVDHLQRREHVAPRLPREVASRRQERRVRSRACPVCRVDRASSARVIPPRRISRAKATAPARRSPLINRSTRPAASASAAANRLARDAHVDGLFDADEPGQTLRALGAGNDAQVHLGLTHLRVRERHAIMTGHRQFEAAAERRTVQRHHHGPVAVFDARQQIVNVRRTRSSAPRGLFELLDVRASGERAAGAHHDNGPNGRVRVDLIERRVQSVDDLRTKRVDGRVVDDDDGDRHGGCCRRRRV